MLARSHRCNFRSQFRSPTLFLLFLLFLGYALICRLKRPFAMDGFVSKASCVCTKFVRVQNYSIQILYSSQATRERILSNESLIKNVRLRTLATRSTFGLTSLQMKMRRLAATLALCLALCLDLYWSESHFLLNSTESQKGEVVNAIVGTDSSEFGGRFEWNCP